MGALEPAGPTGGSAREGSPLVAKKLTFHQLLRDSAAVDGQKGRFPTTAELMKVPRHNLLSSTRLSSNEDSGVAGGDQLDLLQERARAGVLENQCFRSDTGGSAGAGQGQDGHGVRVLAYQARPSASTARDKRADFSNQFRRLPGSPHPCCCRNSAAAPAATSADGAASPSSRAGMKQQEGGKAGRSQKSFGFRRPCGPQRGCASIEWT